MTDHEIEALRRENDSLLKALAACRKAVFSDSGPESEHFAQAIGCPEAVPAYVKDVVEKLRKSRAEALLDAERAREERNREHVRLNAEWMAKCEELRKETIEKCAKECDQLAAENDESMRDEHDERFGVYAKKYRKAAFAIRALAKKEGA